MIVGLPARCFGSTLSLTARRTSLLAYNRAVKSKHFVAWREDDLYN
jgi:hypothetical protein